MVALYLGVALLDTSDSIAHTLIGQTPSCLLPQYWLTSYCRKKSRTTTTIYLAPFCCLCSHVTYMSGDSWKKGNIDFTGEPFLSSNAKTMATWLKYLRPCFFKEVSQENRFKFGQWRQKDVSFCYSAFLLYFDWKPPNLPKLQPMLGFSLESLKRSGLGILPERALQALKKPCCTYTFSFLAEMSRAIKLADQFAGALQL